MSQKKYERIALGGIHTYSITTRDNKVNIRDHFARAPEAGMSFADFYAGLPHLLGADNLRGVVDAVVAAREKGRPVVLAMGGHVISSSRPVGGSKWADAIQWLDAK